MMMVLKIERSSIITSTQICNLHGSNMNKEKQKEIKNTINVKEEVSFTPKKHLKNLRKKINQIKKPPKQGFFPIFFRQADGREAKHNKIFPKLATSYFTIKGRSFSRNISIELHRLVHLMK